MAGSTNDLAQTANLYQDEKMTGLMRTNSTFCLLFESLNLNLVSCNTKLSPNFFTHVYTVLFRISLQHVINCYIFLFSWCMIPLVYSVSRLFNNGGKAYFSIFISSVLLATITLVSFLTITFFSVSR